MGDGRGIAAILQKKYRYGTGNRLKETRRVDSSSSSDGGRQLIIRNGNAVLVPFDCETLYRESKIAEDKLIKKISLTKAALTTNESMLHTEGKYWNITILLLNLLRPCDVWVAKEHSLWLSLLDGDGQ